MPKKKKQGSYVEGGDPDGWKKKGDGEDGEVRKLKNDPHNPKNLLRRKRDGKGDGYNQDGSNWTPTAWNEKSAGKGDKQRPVSIPHKEWGLRYDLAIGEITQEEFDKAMKELNS